MQITESQRTIKEQNDYRTLFPMKWQQKQQNIYKENN